MRSIHVCDNVSVPYITWQLIHTCLLTVDTTCQSDEYDSWRTKFRRPLYNRFTGVYRWTAAYLHRVLWEVVGVGTGAFCGETATSNVSPSAWRRWTFSSADAAAWLHLCTAWLVPFVNLWKFFFIFMVDVSLHSVNLHKTASHWWALSTRCLGADVNHRLHGSAALL